MDACESNQASKTPRPPLIHTEKKNGKPHRPHTKEVISRYKSPTPRRFASPNTTRTVSRRAVSAERRQPDTPRSPPSPSTPVHDTSVDMEMVTRKAASLWPSRMRSLSVSFQSDTFSLPISKREKPPPQALYDRNLKPSSKQTVTSERKRSPLKGKNAIDHSENFKPTDILHSKWPSKTSSNVLNKVIDLPQKPLQKSKCDAAKMLFKFDNQQSQPNFVSSSSSEKPTLPCSPNKPSGVLSRGLSPFRTRALASAPSRGTRSPSPSRQSCNSNTISVLSFIADIKKGQKIVNHIGDAHHLRLLYNRQLQWRFVNASVEAALNSQKVTAERSLINVWRSTLDCRHSVAAKRIVLYQLSLQLKLFSVLNQQMAYLDEWASTEREHSFALYGVTENLQASTLRLPVTGGATADIETVKFAVCSAIQVMQTIGSSIKSTLSRFEETSCLVFELATFAAQERTLVDECEALLASAASLQVEEYSLRTHLVQLKEAQKYV